MPRSSYHHNDLRRALIDAVLAALDAGDADALSMRELAARVGVSHTAAYAHFPDKRALMACAAEHGFDELRHALLRGGARAEEPLARLVACGLAYVAFARRRPGLYRLMFGEADEVDARRGRLERPPSGSAYDVLDRAVAALPYPKPRSPERHAIDVATAWSLVHGIASLEASAAFTGAFASDAAVRRFERAALDALARGLVASEATA